MPVVHAGAVEDDHPNSMYPQKGNLVQIPLRKIPISDIQCYEERRVQDYDVAEGEQSAFSACFKHNCLYNAFGVGWVPYDMMSQRYIRIFSNIIKAGLFVLPFSALIVAGNFWGSVLMPGIGDLFFPFITGKNFFFRIVVEVLFALWACIAFFDRKYRPRMSPLFWSLVATAGILILSTIFSESPYRSFWSNYERMEGLVGHLHLFAYFVVLTSVFTEAVDWRRFFSVSIVASALVSAYAYFQSLGLLAVHQSSERLDATLGNATYLAIYIVFHLFLILFFLLKTEKITMRYLWGALFIFELPVVFLTATRGAILGLLGGSAFFALLLAFTSGSKKTKKLAFGVLIALGIVIGGFQMAKDTNFVQNNYVLKRFAHLSFSEQTVTSRFTIWKMALRGLGEHPILGWGPENFNLVFNKYYEPELWQQEPWFDRAHNIVFDWLIAVGFLGFLAYVSIFISALYILWKSTNRIDTAVFTALFAVYSFHNIFVFDNLISYFMFFSVLGFVHFSYVSCLANQEKDKQRVPADSRVVPHQLHYLGTALVWISVVFVFYFITIKPLLASRALLGSLRDISNKGREVDFILSDFDKVFSYQTFGTLEAREQLVSYANTVLNSDVPNEQKNKVVGKAIIEMEKQISEFPDDARGYLFLSTMYSSAGKSDDALRTLLKAHELSPKKQQIFFAVADAYIAKKQYNDAYDYIKKAYDLDPAFPEATKGLATLAIITGKQAYAEELMTKRFGSPFTADRQLLNAYAQAGNFGRVRDIWLLFLEQEPNNIQFRVNLAATYLKLGNREEAIRQIQKSIEINPNFKEQGNGFIQEIRAGRNP